LSKANLYSDLFVTGNDCSCDLLCDSAEVGVGLELHVTLVARLVIDDLHFAWKKEQQIFLLTRPERGFSICSMVANHFDERVVCCQFHQHLTSRFCADILLPKKFKAK